MALLRAGLAGRLAALAAGPERGLARRDASVGSRCGDLPLSLAVPSPPAAGAACRHRSGSAAGGSVAGGSVGGRIGRRSAASVCGGVAAAARCRPSRRRRSAARPSRRAARRSRSAARAVPAPGRRRRSRSLPVPSPPSFLGSGSIFSSDCMKVFQIPAGIGAAGDRLALELGLHRLELVRVADPDGDGVLLRPADEPGVAVVLGGAGLAGDHHAGDLRARRGALLDDGLQDRGDRGRRPRA